MPAITTRIAAVSAVFFPPEPESRVDDLVAQARAALRPGLRLYTNGAQFALLPQATRGWALFAAGRAQ